MPGRTSAAAHRIVEPCERSGTNRVQRLLALTGITLLFVFAETALSDALQAQAPRDTARLPHSALRDAHHTANGTVWQPLAASVQGWHGRLGAWRLMTHGRVVLGYVNESTYKGGARAGSSNWAMVGATRSTSFGSLSLTAMGSLETITWGECGYPRVFSTGQTCGRDGFHEYHHPHAPVMELSSRWQLELPGDLAVEVFTALIGEPALGPPSYVHRASATDDPIAPITHHEMNPAHTSAGVLTAGVLSSTWKLEASVFNGEPTNPDRVIPEFRALRSVSARAQYAPSSAWSLQVSAGRIRSRETHHAGASALLRMVTASAMHVRSRRAGTHATTLAWSRMDGSTLPRHSLLLESALTFAGHWTIFGRGEITHRDDARHTIIEYPDGSHDHLVDARRATVTQLSAGAAVERRIGAFHVGAGGRASVGRLPDPIVPIYGGRHPVGFALFAHVRPATAHSSIRM